MSNPSGYVGSIQPPKLFSSERKSRKDGERGGRSKAVENLAPTTASNRTSHRSRSKTERNLERHTKKKAEIEFGFLSLVTLFLPPGTTVIPEEKIMPMLWKQNGLNAGELANARIKKWRSQKIVDWLRSEPMINFWRG